MGRRESCRHVDARAVYLLLVATKKVMISSATVIALWASVLGLSVAAAGEWVQTREFGPDSVNLDRGVGGVFYNEGTAKFYAEYSVTLRDNEGVRILVSSAYFQPVVEIRFSRKGALIKRSIPLPAREFDPVENAWMYRAQVDFAPDMPGQYAVLLTTSDISHGWVFYGGAYMVWRDDEPDTPVPDGGDGPSDLPFEEYNQPP